MKRIAIKVVEALRRNDIPAFIFGSVARDILLERTIDRKDIDIMITTNKRGYMLVTRSVMKRLNAVLVSESYLDKNTIFKELWVLEEDNHMYLIEIHYVHIRYDMPLPRPVSHHEWRDYVLPPDLLFFTLMAQLSRSIPYEKRRELLDDLNKLFKVIPKVKWK